MFLLTLMLGVAACGSSPQAPPSRGQWQAVSLDGDRIGHRHIVRQRRGDELITLDTLHLRLQQPGSPLRESTTQLRYRETLDGRPLAMAKTLRSGSANHQMRAEVTGDQLRVYLDGDSAQTSAVAIPDNFYLTEGLRLALLSQQGDQRQLRYHSWSFSQLAFETFQLQARRLDSPPDGLENSGDYVWEIHRQRLGTAAEPPTRLYAGADFVPLAEYSQSSGQEFSAITCSRDCALSEFVPPTHVYRHLLRSPYWISDAALQGKIRYRLQGDLSFAPPSSHEQTVSKVAGGWDITVCESCGEEAPPTAAELARYLSSNHWLAANDPVFKKVVAEALPSDPGSARNTMLRLTRLVTRHMSEVADYAGYATALEAWHKQTGDCTEHALLLATLGRAAGVPTRVVLGLAYNNERFLGRRFVFVPHAWVQAWTGEQWQSFDSGLGDFNAGYIALGISQGEPAPFLDISRQLHRLEITSAAQIKRR